MLTKESFASARWANKKSPFWDLGAQVLVFAWRLEEIYKLHDLLFGFVAAGNILEHNLVLRVFVQDSNLQTASQQSISAQHMTCKT